MRVCDYNHEHTDDVHSVVLRICKSPDDHGTTLWSTDLCWECRQRILDFLTDEDVIDMIVKPKVET